MAYECVKVGAVLKDGFLWGYFGSSSSHGEKRIEALGADWVVARPLNGNSEPELATAPFDTLYSMLEASINYERD